MNKYIIRKNKLLMLAILIISIVVFIGVSQINKNFIESEFIDEANNKFEAIKISGNLKFEEIYRDINTLSNWQQVKNTKGEISNYYQVNTPTLMKPSLGNALEKEIYKEFKQYGEYSDYIDSIYLATEEGGYLAWPEAEIVSNYDPRNRIWYQIGILTGEKISQTSPYFDLITKKMVISNVRTIYNKENKISGVLGLDVDFAYLNSIFDQFKLSQYQQIIVVHKSGFIIADSKYNHNAMGKIEEVYPELSKRFIVGNIYDLNIEEKKYLVTVDIWDNLDWQIYYIADRNLFEENIADINQYYYIILIFLIVTIIIVVITYLFSYKMKLEKQVRKKFLEIENLVGELNEKDRIFNDSEEKYKNLVNNIPGIVFRCEPFQPWVMLSISNEVYNITGYEAVDFLKESHNMVWNNIILKKDRQRVNQMEESKETGVYIVEYRIVHKDGQIKWVMERGRRFQDSNGDVFIDGVIFELNNRN